MNASLRKVLFWCHLTVGVLVASIVVIMSVTGVLLTYQKQMTLWADTRGLDGGPPSPGLNRRPADSLLRAAEAAVGVAPTAITIRSDANAPAEVVFGQQRAFVNAYSGAVLGRGSAGMRAFFRVVTAWHRTVGATGENRAIGRSATGIANLGFLFIVLTGLVLWWPRAWTRTMLRNIALFRGGLRGKARDFNWHNTIGVWSFIPLVAIVASGVVISYSWAGNLVYRVVGESPPQPQNPAGGRGRESAAQTEGAGDRSRVRPAVRPATTAAAADEPTLTIERAMALGAAQTPAWRTISITLPQANAKTLNASIDAGTGGQPQLRGTLVIDRVTGAVTRWDSFASQTPGRRLRTILRFAHTGEVLGLTGQTVAGLVSLGAVFLSWTGIALSLRRLASWRARRARARIGAAATAPGVLAATSGGSSTDAVIN